MALLKASISIADSVDLRYVCSDFVCLNVSFLFVFWYVNLEEKLIGNVIMSIFIILLLFSTI